MPWLHTITGFSKCWSRFTTSRKLNEGYETNKSSNDVTLQALWRSSVCKHENTCARRCVSTCLVYDRSTEI